MKVIILLCSIVAAFADGTCPENQHYSSCGTACPLTCKNYEDPPTACILICNPGCHCNDGYVKTDDGYCVKPENCPNQDNYVRVQQPSSDRCNLPADTGICRGSFPRYYFDRTTGQCQEFVYGGCGGNENNFRTEDECEQTCVKKADKPRIEDCSGPADSGLCYAAIIRYFYDQNEGTCKSFTYGGCGGNSNNFYTEDECREKCESISVCEQEKMTGPCTGAFRRFHFNRQTGQCEPFVYGGCEGNGNNFLTKDQCESSCLDVSVCEQEKVVGPCKAAFHRFYFDKQTRKCESFIYGGCRGNGNNFLTQKDCESSCVAISVCEQEKIVGPCRGTFRRFYFNKQTGQCESFIYGGCRGNGNNFLTKVHCESSCGVCPENQHYDSCGTACPLTCRNYQNPPEGCILMCNPGCHCNSGYVRNDDGGCIRPENCPSEIP